MEKSRPQTKQFDWLKSVDTGPEKNDYVYKVQMRFLHVKHCMKIRSRLLQMCSSPLIFAIDDI